MDIPAQYIHPAEKQCNYSYIHPSSKQCSWEPDLSDYSKIGLLNKDFEFGWSGTNEDFELPFQSSLVLISCKNIANDTIYPITFALTPGDKMGLNPVTETRDIMTFYEDGITINYDQKTLDGAHLSKVRFRCICFA